MMMFIDLSSIRDVPFATAAQRLSCVFVPVNAQQKQPRKKGCIEAKTLPHAFQSITPAPHHVSKNTA